ncbi:hypothetical protein Neosp_014486 [[Neocosmospora] mangrovei]
MGNDKSQSSTPSGKKRGRPKLEKEPDRVKKRSRIKTEDEPDRPKKKSRTKMEDEPEPEPEPERPPPALQPGPKIDSERKFVITRTDAMRRAGGLEKKIGDENYDQMALTTGMKRWLSKPVIMVLSETMKKKVFEWCQQFDPSWLGVLFEAKGKSLVSYEYTATEEEPILPESMFEAFRTLVMGLPADRETYQRLWGLARMVTTHSQRSFLMEELQATRPEFEYVAEGDRTQQYSLRAEQTRLTTFDLHYLTDKNGKPAKTAYGFIASDILAADRYRIISSTFAMTECTTTYDKSPPSPTISICLPYGGHWHYEPTNRGEQLPMLQVKRRVDKLARSRCWSGQPWLHPT